MMFVKFVYIVFICKENTSSAYADMERKLPVVLFSNFLWSLFLLLNYKMSLYTDNFN